MAGAIRVQRKSPRPSQLEVIFTHTAGMLLCMDWLLVSGLWTCRKKITFKTCVWLYIYFEY